MAKEGTGCGPVPAGRETRLELDDRKHDPTTSGASSALKTALPSPPNFPHWQYLHRSGPWGHHFAALSVAELARAWAQTSPGSLRSRVLPCATPRHLPDWMPPPGKA